jgi:hypothetical protein
MARLSKKANTPKEPEVVEQEEASEEEVVEVDAALISTRFECVKFVKQMHTENLEYQWQTKKVYPEDLSIDDIIEDADKLFQYLMTGQ